MRNNMTMFGNYGKHFHDFNELTEYLASVSRLRCGTADAMDAAAAVPAERSTPSCRIRSAKFRPDS